MKKTAVMLLVMVLFSPYAAGAKEVVYWQTVNWPPFQILRGKDAGKGRLNVIIAMFQDRLPQYEHRNIEMNWARYWEKVKGGSLILNSLAIKTEERSRFAVFSKVMTFTLPHRIVLKKETIENAGNPESVAFSGFIRDPRFSGVIEQKRSYSPALDRILEATGAGGNLQRKSLAAENILNMILSGRTDYTIEYPFVVEYLMKKKSPPNTVRMGSIRIEELPRYITARVAAPRTPVGEKVIEDIDRIVGKITATRQYLELHRMWHSDPIELQQIEAIYEELFGK